VFWITLNFVPYILEGRTEAPFLPYILEGRTEAPFLPYILEGHTEAPFLPNNKHFFFFNFAIPFWKQSPLICRHEMSEIIVSLMQKLTSQIS